MLPVPTDFANEDQSAKAKLDHVGGRGGLSDRIELQWEDTNGVVTVEDSQPKRYMANNNIFQTFQSIIHDLRSIVQKHLRRDYANAEM
jgi:hypothetical protein